MTRQPRWIRKWLRRHQSGLSLCLHAVGIPMTIAAVGVVVMQWDQGVREWALPAAGLLAIGFLLQYLGHAHEGNDMGEIILIKRLLRRPYTSISPRYADKRQSV